MSPYFTTLCSTILVRPQMQRIFRVFLVPFAALLLYGTRADAETLLGSRLTEFYHVLGKPSYHEHLGRTANVRWTPLRSSDAALLAARAFALEVEGIDGVVCRVVVRCRRPLSDAETTRIAQRFFPRRYIERTRYKPNDGDYVDSGPSDNGHIVVVSDKTYWHNVEVFDGEAAKVRPPTSNH